MAMGMREARRRRGRKQSIRQGAVEIFLGCRGLRGFLDLMIAVVGRTPIL
jgi:hypothetical protein